MASLDPNISPRTMELSMLQSVRPILLSLSMVYLLTLLVSTLDSHTLECQPCTLDCTPPMLEPLLSNPMELLMLWLCPHLEWPTPRMLVCAPITMENKSLAELLITIIVKLQTSESQINLDSRRISF